MTGFDVKELDRIGERLRSGSASEADYVVLDAWRRSFAAALDEVTNILASEFGVHATQRPMKSTATIVRKLRERPTMRLSQLRDIAGCRVVVDDLTELYAIVARVPDYFRDSKPRDHISTPTSAGYRAYHFELMVADRRVELQIRTTLQDLWAKYAELRTYHVDADLRLGRGNAALRSELLERSGKYAQADEQLGADAALARRQAAFSFTMKLDFLRYQHNSRTRIDADE